MSIEQRKDRYALFKAGFQMSESCDLCGSTNNLVIDHIIALSQGGSNELDNLRTLCSSCNTKEGWQNRERAETVKYTTHLLPWQIKAIKRWAFEHDMKDYEVVEAAILAFLKEQKAKEQNL